MKSFFIFIFLFSLNSFGQYSPRGTNYNDGYLPLLDVPDKWILGIDGMFDWQKENNENQSSSFQTTHAHLNFQYGGQVFRGGFQLIHDFSRDIKDISIGLGFTYNRPFFVELGAGYLTRTLTSQSFDGWSYNLKLGYYFNWYMHIKYRFRLRLSLNFNYKTLNTSPTDTDVLHTYPLLGLEFET